MTFNKINNSEFDSKFTLNHSLKALTYLKTRGFNQVFYDKIKSMMDYICIFFNTYENLLFHSSFIVISAICSFLIFIISQTVVPREISMGRDAYLYMLVAERWLNGWIFINVNYDFGLSLFEILAISLGSLFGLDPIQSLIIFFSTVSCLSMFLLAILSRILTNNRWSYHVAIIFVATDFTLVYLSVRPLTDTFHAMLILLIILIQIKLLKFFSNEGTMQHSNINILLLALSLGVCSGIITTVRHSAITFLLLIILLWGAFIFLCDAQTKRKITLFSLIIFPSLLIMISYLFLRCTILGDIKYLFYFGATSNIWIDSPYEQWYYFMRGLPNPTLHEYLQTHTLNYIFQRELLGIFSIFREFIGHFSVLLFFLVLGVISLFRKNYRIIFILFAPIFYVVVIYGWFWNYIYHLRLIRYLLPTFYIFYLISIYSIQFLLTEIGDRQTSTRFKDMYIGLSVVFLGLYLIIRAFFNLKRFAFDGFDLPLLSGTIAFLLIFGVFFIIFYPKKIKEMTIDNLRSVIQRYL